MDRLVAKTIVEACHNFGLEAELYEDYSGRGMYGLETTGVVLSCSLEDVICALIDQAELFCPSCGDNTPLPRLKSDDLGLHTIIY
jgi:hypothetical protein